MSLATRKELLMVVQKRYKQATWHEKKKILDELIATTNYQRKYAIHLLGQDHISICSAKSSTRTSKKKYDEVVKQALLTVWNSANQICSKRLVPFMPDLVGVLERFGYLSLPEEVRKLLLKLSPATMDRLLMPEREENRKKGISTTSPGSLLKRQIKIRTFADWNDIVPGFLEGDLVAHCGARADGSFLNTLVLTDIASTWTEFFPLLRKSEADVIAALEVAQQLLPFGLLGLDTDNGSEFINYTLLNFCKDKKITFTRARAYKKNDQAHVEEKNGSIVRRIVGYDRYEGLAAYNALTELYGTLRLYVNFFQPSLKLLSKKRDGAKVTKNYDKAKTPCQRLLASTNVSEEVKEKLRIQYLNLDPFALLKELEKLQDNFWKHAWKAGITEDIVPLNATEQIATNKDLLDGPSISNNHPTQAGIKPVPVIRRYRHTRKPRKNVSNRTWRTRQDPFAMVWDKIRLQLELCPERTAKSLLEELINENPKQFNINLLRTLQRLVAVWRIQQTKINQARVSQENASEDKTSKQYVSLLANVITQL